MLRSSYGLCGIVYEVTLKTRPLLPLAVHFESFTLDEFSDRLIELTQRGDSLFLYIFPFEDRVTVEFRHYNPGASGTPNRFVWRARNFGWGTAVPFLARGLEPSSCCSCGTRSWPASTPACGSGTTACCAATTRFPRTR